MIIHIAADHAGFEMKQFLKSELIKMSYVVLDHGAEAYNEKDDYPDFVTPCALAVAADDMTLGIVLGGSGQGEQIVANKIPGIRAVEYYGGNTEVIKLGREHNDANILSLGARFITNEEALAAVKVFIENQFSNSERHVRRIKEITEVEKDN